MTATAQKACDRPTRTQARLGPVQARVVALMRSGYRLAVRRWELEDSPVTYRSCLLYSTDLTAQPPYRRIRWRTVSRLLEVGAIRLVRTVGGDEDHYALAPEYADATDKLT